MYLHVELPKYDVPNVDYDHEYANGTPWFQLFMRVGIYHGDEIMCAPQNTKSALLDADRCASWEDETLNFEIELCDIPRMARLCFLLCATVDKRKKGGPGTMGRPVKVGDQEVVTLAWLNFTIFDYKDRMRSGHETVHMWAITDDSLLSEELLNPIGESGARLTHWGRDKMDAISQATFSNAFSWMKLYEFQLKFHWSLFLRVQLTILQHWSR